jgi:cytochrome c oxidase subunit 4
MSTTQTPPAPDATDPHVHHPTPRDYVRIAVILFVLTAMEVSTYFLDFGAIAVPLLIVLMLIKFVLVASWFMHLKFDSKHYTRLLYAGLTLAIFLYALTLVLFRLGHFPTL